MTNEAHLDNKYFIDSSIYNCPFCGRRHVSYTNYGYKSFNWSKEETCNIWFVKCDSCKKISAHFTKKNVREANSNLANNEFINNKNLDNYFFIQIPSSSFVLDLRIPKIIRDLISESEQCLKGNHLTGASACIRKAIYELVKINKCEGCDYEEKIKSLKSKFPNIEAEYFDTLSHIQDMTSDKLHEFTWEKFDSQHAKLYLEILKNILEEVYVFPDEKLKKANKVKELLKQKNNDKKEVDNEEVKAV